MNPTMKFRWWSQRNAVTAEHVLAEREKSGETLAACKTRLLQATEPVLQQWVSASGSEGPELGAQEGAWLSVPVVVEQRNSCSMHYASYKAICAAPELLVEFLHGVQSGYEDPVRRALNEQPLHDYMRKNIQVAEQPFSRFAFFAELERESFKWDMDDVSVEVRRALAEKAEALRKRDGGCDVGHFIAGYDAMVDGLKHLEKNVGLRLGPADALAATVFWKELTESVETLGEIADVHGVRTLTDLMYLHAAILEGGVVDVWTAESSVATVVEGLPSASRWMGSIRIRQDKELSSDFSTHTA
jgi:hypothetical protein